MVYEAGEPAFLFVLSYDPVDAFSEFFHCVALLDQFEKRTKKSFREVYAHVFAHVLPASCLTGFPVWAAGRLGWLNHSMAQCFTHFLHGHADHLRPETALVRRLPGPG